MNISPSLQIDFSEPSFLYRLSHLQGRNELIAKAIGYRPGNDLTLFDTTAGLGKESFLLAALGCRIILFERHPLVAKALGDALAKAKENPSLCHIVERMTFHPRCAIEALQAPTDYPEPDVIYCDPMFLPRTKSALVKKQMQQLQTLVGQDQDAELLISLALTRAKQRVVVKRALSSPPLIRQPSFSLSAKSHRFDVYCLCS